MKAILLLTLILTTSLFGQTLSRDSAKVPPTFKGNDARIIAKGLLLSPLFKRKDEFESTAAYEKRLNDTASVTFADGSNAAAVLVFKVTDINGRGAALDSSGASYDADTETLTFKLDVTEFRNYEATIKAAEPTVLLAPSDYKDLGSYIGENAYGTKREVHKSEFTGYRLLINNELAFPKLTRTAYGYSPITVAVKLPPEQARQAKAAFGVLYFAKLVRPYLGLSFLSVEPKIDNPREIKNVTYNVYADVSEIWIFNTVSGEIYSKVRARESTPSEKVPPTQPPTILQ